MIESWLLHTLVGGGLLLLMAAWLLLRTRQPARRQRLAEWALASALLLALLSLGPAWLIVVVPEAPAAPTAAVAKKADEPLAENGPKDAERLVPFVAAAGEAVDLPPLKAAREAAPAQPEPTLSAPVAQGPGWIEQEWPRLLIGAYIVGATLLTTHWLLGHLALAWLLRAAGPASERAARLFEQMTTGKRRPRLLVSRRVAVPFSFGLLRPTVVLPESLTEDGIDTELRWVFAHELAHLERRDAWSCLLFGLGQVIFYVLPWFWSLRRQARLSQEYLADAAALAAGGCPEDYAQFLLRWANAPALPAGASGVQGHSSDLFRRVTMLLKPTQTLEKRCPRGWSASVACSLLALAVLGAGVGLRAAANDEPKKEEGKKADVQKDEKKDREKGELPDFLPKLADLPGVDPDQLAELRKQMEEVRREMRRVLEMARVAPGAGRLGGRFGKVERSHDGRLGVMIDAPSATLADQLDLPKGMGMVVEDVKPDSAAAKVGMKAHDILLELGGKAVPSDVAEFVKQLNKIKANTPVDVVVLRKGKKETLKGVSLPDAKASVAVPSDPFVIPALPAIPAVPALPFGRGAVGGPGGSTSISRKGDDFTAKHEQAGVATTVTGKIVDGKAVPSEIEVRDGAATTKYASVDKMPEKYQEKAKKLIEMAGTGRLKLELRRP